MISAQALIFRSLFSVFENLLPLWCWLSSYIPYNHKQCLLCWMLLNQLCVFFTFKPSSHSHLVYTTAFLSGQQLVHNPQTVHLSIRPDRLTFCDHLIKWAAKTKMRNTSNVSFTNLLRDLTLTPFWYLHCLLFATTPPVKVHSLCSRCSCVQPCSSDTVWPKSQLCAVTTENHHSAAHSPWRFFILRTNTTPTSSCSFLLFLSPSTLSQIPQIHLYGQFS